jgi:hypothetical protein
MNISIDPQSWHCRVYLWWYQHKYKARPERSRSNLCPYMRVIMFWAPMRAVFGTWVKVWRVPMNAVTIPMIVYGVPKMAGYFSYGIKLGLWHLYAGTLLVIVLATVVVLAIYSLDKDGWDVTKPIRGAIKRSKFKELFVAYLRSAHDRMCPEIDWRQ